MSTRSIDLSSVNAAELGDDVVTAAARLTRGDALAVAALRMLEWLYIELNSRDATVDELVNQLALDLFDPDNEAFLLLVDLNLVYASNPPELTPAGEFIATVRARQVVAGMQAVDSVYPVARDLLELMVGEAAGMGGDIDTVRRIEALSDEAFNAGIRLLYELGAAELDQAAIEPIWGVTELGVVAYVLLVST